MGASLRLRHYLRWGWHCQKWATCRGVCLVRVYLPLCVCVSVCVLVCLCVGAVRSPFTFLHYISFYFSFSAATFIYLPFGCAFALCLANNFNWFPLANPIFSLSHSLFLPTTNWKWWRNDFIYNSHTQPPTHLFIQLAILFVLHIIKVDLAVVAYTYYPLYICMWACVSV